MPPYPDSNFSVWTRSYLSSEQSEIDLPSEINLNGITNFNLMVVCVRFEDKLNNTPAKYLDSLVFNENFGTMKNWYLYESYGKFNINSVDTVWWTLAPRLYSYYVNGQKGLGDYPNNTQKLIEDLVDSIDQFIDFSRYDNDHDGFVDGLLIVHTGQGSEYTGDQNDIWSHKWAVNNLIKDGVKIHDFCIVPEYWISPGDMTIGVFCHEFAHVLGVPDLYDLDGSSHGIGNWSVMASGSWNGALGNSPASFDSWSRIKLGFAHEENFYRNLNVTINPSNSDSTIIRLWANGGLGNYYYLLENRQQKSYDTFSPGKGLLIWKIDETKSNNMNEWYPESILPPHQNVGNYHVALVQADGSYDIERRRNRGDSYDTYPNFFQGYLKFDKISNPSSDWYDGSGTFISVENILNLDSNISCDISVEPNTSVTNEDSEIIYSGRVFLYRNSNHYTIYSTSINSKISCEIFNILGQKIANLESDKNFVEWFPSSFLSRGIYFITSTNRYGVKSYTKTFKISL